MIEPITSLADLFYKVKAQEPYRRLLFISVRNIFYSKPKISSYDLAFKRLSEYDMNDSNCSYISGLINLYRNKIDGIIDLEVDKLLTIKNREMEGNDSISPAPIFNGEYMTTSSQYYEAASSAYERMRLNLQREAEASAVAAQNEVGERNEYEVIQGNYISPMTGHRCYVQRHIRRDTPLDVRRTIEDEVASEIERRAGNDYQNSTYNYYQNYYSRQVPIAPIPTNNYWRDIQHTDYLDYWQRPVVVERINEDNPNNDR